MTLAKIFVDITVAMCREMRKKHPANEKPYINEEEEKETGLGEGSREHQQKLRLEDLDIFKSRRNLLSYAMANRKPQLPKSVLDMKFMKKTKDRIQKELENIEDHGSLYTNTVSSDKRAASINNYISESSFIYCEDLIEGRLSFKGMNPEIERLMELENQPLTPEEDMKKDVSDEILVKKMEAFHQRKRPYSSPSTASIKKKKY